MQNVSEMVGLLLLPFIICLVMSALHAYMGLHVVKRGIIFVDLSLAQMAALGATVALLLWPLFHPHVHHAEVGSDLESQIAALEAEAADQDTGGYTGPAEVAEEEDAAQGRFTYGLSVGFAILGALLLTLGRFRDEIVPHEAMIGILFVVSAALAVMVLSKAPHGHEKMQAMLVGSILFVTARDAWTLGILYAVLGLVHIFLRRPLMRISDSVRDAEAAGIRVRWWDFLFYVTFAVMVTESVRVAGVLVVFSFLVIPAVCALLMLRGFGKQLVLAWTVSLVASVLGLFVSAQYNMPTGPSLVSAFAIMLVLFLLARWMRRTPAPAAGP
jgi:zinc/manganese transport system permease protein